MEVLIDCYFDRLFAEMERSCLASRYKRRELVNYFTDVINSCAEGNKIYDINVPIHAAYMYTRVAYI